MEQKKYYIAIIFGIILFGFLFLQLGVQTGNSDLTGQARLKAEKLLKGEQRMQEQLNAAELTEGEEYTSDEHEHMQVESAFDPKIDNDENREIQQQVQAMLKEHKASAEQKREELRLQAQLYAQEVKEKYEEQHNKQLPWGQENLPERQITTKNLEIAFEEAQRNINEYMQETGEELLFEELLDQSVPFIEAPVASLQQQGSSWQNAPYLAGENIDVCIIDSGIDYNHPAFQNNYVDGYDFVNNDNDPMDDHFLGHGTAIAGIVASQDAKHTGVAPAANLYIAKAIDQNGVGTIADVTAALRWCLERAINPNPTVPFNLTAAITADPAYSNIINQNFNVETVSIQTGQQQQQPSNLVILMPIGIENLVYKRPQQGSSANALSFTGPAATQWDYCPDHFGPLFDLAQQARIPIITATGNLGSADGVQYPSCDLRTFSAGASDYNDEALQASNRGGQYNVFIGGQAVRSELLYPNIYAPGHVITSTKIGGGFIDITGSSAGAAHVAGAVAALHSFQPYLGRSNIPSAQWILTNDPRPPRVYDPITNTDTTRLDFQRSIRGTGCVNPTDNMFITQDTIFCPGNFQLTTPIVITATNRDITVECQNTQIEYQNMQSGTAAVVIQGNSQTSTIPTATFEGCHLTGEFNSGLFVIDINSNIRRNIIETTLQSSNSWDGIYVLDLTNSQTPIQTNIDENTIKNMNYGIYTTVDEARITNNIIEGTSTRNYEQFNNVITNGQISGIGIQTEPGRQDSKIHIENNQVRYFETGMVFDETNEGNSFENVIEFNGGRGIRLSNDVEKVNIYDNTIFENELRLKITSATCSDTQSFGATQYDMMNLDQGMISALEPYDMDGDGIVYCVETINSFCFGIGIDAVATMNEVEIFTNTIDTHCNEGIYINEAQNSTIHNNNIKRNAVGIWYNAQNAAINNIISYNEFPGGSERNGKAIIAFTGPTATDSIIKRNNIHQSSFSDPEDYGTNNENMWRGNYFADTAPQCTQQSCPERYIFPSGPGSGTTVDLFPAPRPNTAEDTLNNIPEFEAVDHCIVQMTQQICQQQGKPKDPAHLNDDELVGLIEYRVGGGSNTPGIAQPWCVVSSGAAFPVEQNTNYNWCGEVI